MKKIEFSLAGNKYCTFLTSEKNKIKYNRLTVQLTRTDDTSEEPILLFEKGFSANHNDLSHMKLSDVLQIWRNWLEKDSKRKNPSNDKSKYIIIQILRQYKIEQI